MPTPRRSRKSGTERVGTVTITYKGGRKATLGNIPKSSYDELLAQFGMNYPPRSTTVADARGERVGVLLKGATTIRFNPN